jgi:Phycobilisome protein
MSSQIQELIYQASERYLGTEEVELLQAYVTSLPERIALYKLLRDREVNILQAIADQVQQELPNAEVGDVERGIKNLVLVMRYSAMAMLLNDENHLKQRLLGWLEQVMASYDLRQLNELFYKLLNQTLRKELSDKQVALIQPLISQAQVALVK